jgi:hypothetical protein
MREIYYRNRHVAVSSLQINPSHDTLVKAARILILWLQVSVMSREVSVHKISRFSFSYFYWGADKSLARPASRCILFDGENISFDASLVIYK